MERLRLQFGKQLNKLSGDQRLILATTAMEEMVTHARMLSICDLHSVDLTRMLQGLVQDGFLHQSGRTRAAVYLLPGTVLPSPDAVFGARNLPTMGRENGGKPSESNSEGLPRSSEASGTKLALYSQGLEYPLVDSLQDLDQQLQADLEQVASSISGQGKVLLEATRLVIARLCQGRYLTIRVLSHLLGRDLTPVFFSTWS